MSVLGSYEFSNVSHIAISSLVGKVKTKFSHYTQPTLSARENGLRCLSSKESSCPAGEAGNDPWVGKTPWKRKWQPTPLFLPGKSMDRGASSYSPRVARRHITVSKLLMRLKCPKTERVAPQPTPKTCIWR